MESRVLSILKEDDDIQTDIETGNPDLVLPEKYITTDDENENEEEDSSNNKSKTPIITHIAAITALIPNASYDTFSAIDCLKLHSFNSTPLAFVTGAVAAAASIGFNEESIIENAKEINTLKNYQRPSEWRPLTTRQIAIVISLSSLPVITTVLLHSVELFFLVNKLPQNYTVLSDIPSPIVLSVGTGTAVVAGSSYFTNQCMTTIKTIFLAANKTTYTTRASRLICPPSSTVIGAAAMLTDFMLLYLSAKYSAQSLADLGSENETEIDIEIAKYFYGLASLLNSITSFCYSKTFSRDSLNRFSQYLNALKNSVLHGQLSLLHALEITAFITSSILSIYLSLLGTTSNQKGYEEVANDFGLGDFEATTIIVEILAWISTTYLTVINTASLYDPVFQFSHSVLKQTSSLVQAIWSLFTKAAHLPLTLSLSLEKRTVSDVGQPLLHDNVIDDDENLGMTINPLFKNEMRFFSSPKQPDSLLPQETDLEIETKPSSEKEIRFFSPANRSTQFPPPLPPALKNAPDKKSKHVCRCIVS